MTHGPTSGVIGYILFGSASTRGPAVPRPVSATSASPPASAHRKRFMCSSLSYQISAVSRQHSADCCLGKYRWFWGDADSRAHSMSPDELMLVSGLAWDSFLYWSNDRETKDAFGRVISAAMPFPALRVASR